MIWLDVPEKPIIPLRVRVLLLAALVLFAGLVIRLWYLQIALGPELQEASRMNTVRWDRLSAPRGTLTDRKGRLIATVNLQEVVYISPADAAKYPETLAQAAAILETTVEDLQEILKHSQTGYYKPVPIAVGLKPEQLTALMENQRDLPGLLIWQQPVREYKDGWLWAHSVGYVGPISENELKESKDGEYASSDYVGKVGVEAAQEKRLKGVPGGEQYEVDAKGRRLRLLTSTDPAPGEKLALTFDASLQQVSLEALGEEKGAVVAIAPKTGEVLAMVSKPTFDPNVFTKKLSAATWRGLSDDPDHPMLNRAIRTALSPGSTFKMITAMAALESGAITLNTTCNCPGVFRLGKWSYRCHSRHGYVNFSKSLVQSCDVYYYRAGLAVGVDKISEMAFKCGLGARTGIDMIPLESKGLIPTPEWKLKVTKGKEGWRTGNTVNMSIGQGDVLTTPLQMACFASLLANRGVMYKPVTVQRAYRSGKLIDSAKPEAIHQVNLAPQYWDAIIQAMTDTTEVGTAKGARVPGVSIASKTGSAEQLGGKTHAWLVAFAPVENPQIALCVMIERGGHGGDAAAPVAQKVLKAFFKK